MKKTSVLVACVIVATVAATARCEFVLYGDRFATDCQYNYWDAGVHEVTDFAHSGTYSLTNSGPNACIFVRNDPVAPTPHIQLNGNTYATFWVYETQNILNKIGVRLQNGTDPVVGSDLKPYNAGNEIMMSTNGTDFTRLSSWSQVPLNTWALLKVDFANNGFTIDSNTYFHMVGLTLNWNAPVDAQIWLDDMTLGGAANPPPTYHPGDANGDGAVTDADYTLWADNYNAANATWGQGDFNVDGAVTDADYTLWADNYGYGTGDVVPEPATLSLLGLGLFGRSRRRQ